MKKFIINQAVAMLLIASVCPLVSMQPSQTQLSQEQANGEWYELFKKLSRSQPVDIERVQRLLASGADINSLDEDNNTLLGKAIYYRDKKLVELLISKGAQVTLTPAQNKLNRRPIPPLNQAIATRDAAFVQLLLKAGAPIQFGWGEYPLNVAIANQSMDIVKLLLDYGADVNHAENNGDTPLHYAIMYAPTLIPLLIESGADMSIKNKAGQTPVDLAKARIQADTTDENAQKAVQFLTAQKLK